MRVADSIGLFLKEYVSDVFCISGGASLWIIHGLVNAGVNIVCPQGEQGASFQADCYARIRGMGCALATSGPGASNLITGIAASYYDSTPVLYLTGNQTRERLNTYGTRGYGFQATPIVDIVKPITKYAVTVMDPNQVIPELKKAIQIAKSGRMGPVLCDIPDDLQRSHI